MASLQSDLPVLQDQLKALKGVMDEAQRSAVNLEGYASDQATKVQKALSPYSKGPLAADIKKVFDELDADQAAMSTCRLTAVDAWTKGEDGGVRWQGQAINIVPSLEALTAKVAAAKAKCMPANGDDPAVIASQIGDLRAKDDPEAGIFDMARHTYERCVAGATVSFNKGRSVNAVLKMDGAPVPDVWGGWDVAVGHIHTKIPNGTEGTYTWDAPPQSIGADGFAVTLTVQAQSVKGDGYDTGIGMGVNSGSMTLSPDPAQAHVDPKNGDSDSLSVTVTAKPAPAYNPGDVVEFKIGAFWGPGVTYRYKAVAAGQ